ncbi:MAG: hypothetical protein AAGF11_44440 [Myxococcota bacterium]
MTRRTDRTNWWTVTLVAGLTTTLVAVGIMSLFPTSSAGDTSGYGSPVIAFEFARTPADLLVVFGPESDPQRAERIRSMDLGNRWDYLFLVTYGAFMALFCWSAFKDTDRSSWLIPAAAGVLSAVMDAVENTMLLEITKDLHSTPWLDLLPIPVHAKFSSIALSSIAGALYIASNHGVVWRLLAVVAIAAGIGVLVALTDPPGLGWLLTSAVAAAWSIQLLYAGFRVLRRPSTEHSGRAPKRAPS